MKRTILMLVCVAAVAVVGVACGGPHIRIPCDYDGGQCEPPPEPEPEPEPEPYPEPECERPEEDEEECPPLPPRV